ncbi:hypothetical protein M5V91_14635 [Cytobacillus pseudoceanisediminis]|uniref:hypothetical protein n=1 Tax=Cytobacillus pseudoceanisediminis TaxID=3051614 RepID=UPI00218C6DAE|nr:hypothetical protein [Cytobacillus pseudoceanisediminis]UQX52300.1 hypothetical protein M5V91_14635 [Cytobacillus pseudoceanisediminis]
MEQVEQLVTVARKFLYAKPEIEKIQKNRKEIYKISKLLPENEGYRLMVLFDQSVNASGKAISKIYK